MAIEDLISQAKGIGDALAAIVAHFRADSGTAHFLAEDGLLHLAAATPGIPEPVLAAINTIPVGKGMAGLAVQHGRPIDACNIQTDTSGSVRPGARATGLSGAVVVPMFRGEAVAGALGIATRHERTFSKQEIEELLGAGRALAAQASGGTELLQSQSLANR